MKRALDITKAANGLQQYNNAWFARGRAPRPQCYIVSRDAEGARSLTLPCPIIAGQEIKTLRQIMHALRRGDTVRLEKTL